MDSLSYRTIFRSGPRLILAVCWALLECGCTTAPTQVTGIPVHFVGCSSNLIPPVIANGNPNAVLILFGLEIGYDVGVYGTCVVGKLTQHASDAPVLNGVYHSRRNTYSVNLPSPPAGVRNPSINIVEPTVLPSDFAIFWPRDDGAGLKSGAIAYGV